MKSSTLLQDTPTRLDKDLTWTLKSHILVNWRSEMDLQVLSSTLPLWIHARARLPRITNSPSLEITGWIIRSTRKTRPTIIAKEADYYLLTLPWRSARELTDGWDRIWPLMQITWTRSTACKDSSPHRTKLFNMILARPLPETTSSVEETQRKEKRKSNQWRHYSKSKKDGWRKLALPSLTDLTNPFSNTIRTWSLEWLWWVKEAWYLLFQDFQNWLQVNSWTLLINFTVSDKKLCKLFRRAPPLSHSETSSVALRFKCSGPTQVTRSQSSTSSVS